MVEAQPPRIRNRHYSRKRISLDGREKNTLNAKNQEKTMVCLASVVHLARMDYFLGRSLDRLLERSRA